METLVSAQTDAATSDAFRVLEGEPATIIANGLAGAEEAVIQVAYDEDAENFQDYYYGGDKVALTATNNALKLDATGTYKVAKGASAGAASVVGDARVWNWA